MKCLGVTRIKQIFPILLLPRVTLKKGSKFITCWPTKFCNVSVKVVNRKSLFSSSDMCDGCKLRIWLFCNVFPSTMGHDVLPYYQFHLNIQYFVLYAYRAFCIIGEHLNSSFPIPAIVTEICLCYTMAYLTPIVVCSKVTKPETK